MKTSSSPLSVNYSEEKKKSEVFFFYKTILSTVQQKPAFVINHRFFTVYNVFKEKMQETVGHWEAFLMIHN